MKALVSSAELATALKHITRSVPKRPSHPVLANILVVAAGGRLKLRAYNLSGDTRQVEMTIPAEVEVEGETTIPAFGLRDFVVDDGLCVMLESKSGESEESQQIVVSKFDGTNKKGSCTFPTITADDYPEMNLGEKIEERLSISPGPFMDAINNVIHAVSKDEAKPLLTTVNLQIDVKGNRLQVAATDGHRLSVSSVDLSYVVGARGTLGDSGDSHDSPEPLNVNIPSYAFVELSKVVGKQFTPLSPKAIHFVIANHVIEITYGNYTIIFPAVVGTYPNYAQLTPSSFLRTATLSGNDLAGILKLAGKVAKDYNNVVRFSFGSDEVAVSAKGNETRVFSSSLPYHAENGDFDGFEIAFNVTYIQDALKCEGLMPTKDSDVTIKMNAPTTPVILQSVESDGTIGDDLAKANFYELIMPVQIRS